jgi:hypothetical protein
LLNIKYLQIDPQIKNYKFCLNLVTSRRSLAIAQVEKSRKH